MNQMKSVSGNMARRVQLAALFACAIAGAMPVFAAVRLSEPVNGLAATPTTENIPGTLRAKAVKLDFAPLRAIRDQGDRSPIVFANALDGNDLQVNIERFEPTSSGGTAYIGKVPGDPMSIAVLVENPGAVSFNVSTHGKRFMVTGTADRGYVARELGALNLPDHRSEPREYNFPSAKQPAQPGAPAVAPAEVAADTGATVDVMVIYTNTARIQHGGTPQMHAAIDAQVALTNQIYLNSNVVQRLRLVYKGEVTHTESISDTDLDRAIDPADGFLDQIPILRDLYAADIVSLWGNYPDTCGLGSLMANESLAFASVAYNVVNSPACTTGNAFTFAHELGHNMGLRHDPFVDPGSTTVTPAAGGAAVSVAYAHGYIDLVNRFRTVMSYNDQCTTQMPAFNCSRIPNFSNPAVTFDNRPNYAPAAAAATTGNAANSHEQRALDDTRETTANFKQGLASFTGPGIVIFTTPRATVQEAAGSVTLRVARHVGSTGAISVNWATANGTATAGADYTAANGTLNWADGDTLEKTITINVSQDTLLEGKETFTVSLTTPTGGASIGSAGGVSQTATVSIIDDDPDNYPPGGVVPADYTQGNVAVPWTVDTTDGYLSPTSIRSPQIYSPDQSTNVFTSLSYTGNFNAGNATFAYRVSSYSTFYGTLEFQIDNVTVFTSAGGETGWLTTTQAIPAGNHTVTWRFRHRLNFPCANAVPAAPGGANCADRAWIDSVVLPLSANTLSVIKGGTGSGSVTGAGINCGADCVETAAAGTMFTLTATPSLDSSFAGWSGGGCSGTGTCSVTLNSSTAVTALFDRLPEVFPPNCQFPPGFTNQPAGAIAGWSSATDQARTGTCSLKSDIMGQAGASGQANSNKARFSITGNFLAGTISFYYKVSSEAQWDCFRFLIGVTQQNIGGTCTNIGGLGASGDVSTWTLVSIPVAAGNNTFTWSYEKDNIGADGADAAWVDDLVLPPLAPVVLTTAKAGTGSGTVSGTGINCGVDCTESVTPGTMVTLTATPSTGSTFTGWSGGVCTGTGTCQVTVNADTSVTATFTLNQYLLSVSKNGTGTGTVTSPSGINCGVDCSETLNHGTMVTLTATPAMGSSFSSWSGGGCGMMNPCVVTLTAATTVTATFNIAAMPPGAPTLNSLTAGNAQAIAFFTAPASDGGAPITLYTVQCPDAAAMQPTAVGTGTSSPITVTGMANGVTYNCRVIATNSAGNSLTSNQISVTPSASPPFGFVSADSRKTHGGVTKYKVPITIGPLLNGAISVEPRSGSSHEIVFTFNGTVTSVGSVSTSVGSASSTFSGTELSVVLNGVPDNSRVAVTVNGVNGSVSQTANIGFIAGDVSNSRSVSAVDIAAVKSRSGNTVTTDAQARFDIMTNGTINNVDISAVKAKSGQVLP
jgi:hypothetical protein